MWKHETLVMCEGVPDGLLQLEDGQAEVAGIGAGTASGCIVQSVSL